MMLWGSDWAFQLPPAHCRNHLSQSCDHCSRLTMLRWPVGKPEFVLVSGLLINTGEVSTHLKTCVSSGCNCWCFKDLSEFQYAYDVRVDYGNFPWNCFEFEKNYREFLREFQSCIPSNTMQMPAIIPLGLTDTTFCDSVFFCWCNWPSVCYSYAAHQGFLSSDTDTH